MRYHHTLLELLKIRQIYMIKFRAEDEVADEGECKIEQTLGNTVWQLLPKLNIVVAYDPASALRAICLTDLKSYVYTKARM